MEVFAAGLNRPFGIAFYPLGPNPQYVYVGNTDSIVRFPYQTGDLKARGPKEVHRHRRQFPGGGHSTRDVAFSQDGKKMYVGVGSRSNVDDPDTTPAEKDRATILEFNLDGTGRRVYASGIRNAVGLAVHPTTGQLWVSVNERDNLGDNLVPDYITHVEEGGFYGWPWYYLGGNQDPRHDGKHPELKATVKVPDVLLQPHSGSLEMVVLQRPAVPGRAPRQHLRRHRTDRGTRRRVPATRSSACRCRTASRPASTRTSSPASSRLTARSGAVPWASPSPPTAHSWSPTMPRTRSGEWRIRGRSDPPAAAGPGVPACQGARVPGVPRCQGARVPR